MTPDGFTVREVTDQDARDYMLAQRAAWFDCKLRLAWLRDYFYPDE